LIPKAASIGISIKPCICGRLISVDVPARGYMVGDMKQDIRSRIEALGYDTELRRPGINFKIATGMPAPSGVCARVVRACAAGVNTPWRSTWAAVLNDVATKGGAA